jgi:hypothetical protein
MVCYLLPSVRRDPAARSDTSLGAVALPLFNPDDLVHPAVLRRLVGAPAREPRAVPELAAADAVGAEFGYEDRFEPDSFCVLPATTR